MSNLNHEQAKALQMAYAATLATIQSAGPDGAPSGVVYAALMTYGCTLNQFQSLTQGMEKQGHINFNDLKFTITHKGSETLARLEQILN